MIKPHITSSRGLLVVNNLIQASHANKKLNRSNADSLRDNYKFQQAIFWCQERNNERSK